MANEVNNETTNAATDASGDSQQTGSNDSVETPTEQTATAATTTDAPQATAATEQPATEAQPASGAPQAADDSASTTQTTAAAENQTAAASGAAATTETPAQSEEDFGAILEKFEPDQAVFHNGDLVEGTVVGLSERGVLISFGYKSEGIAPIEDFTSSEGEVTVQKGDKVEAIIKSISSGDAPPQLSRADALTRKSWNAIEEAYNNQTPITGRAVEVTKGGLLIDIGGVEAFMPGSQVDSRPNRNINMFVGQDIEAQVIKFSRKRNNIVLSRKVLTDEAVNKQKAETLSGIEEGYVVEGKITNLMEYGAFVDIGGIDGLLHVTDMSWGRQLTPSHLFKMNDAVQVKVLKLDRATEKISLGYKQLIADPWSTVMELYPVGSRVKGRVSSVAEYGAFIELEPGVEGLVHVSEMTWSKRSVNPKRLVHSGEEVEVQVLGIDTDERRISLGMKQLQPNPWQTVRDRYSVGQTVRGKVRNITDFGAFVEIEDGIDGLVHVSDISHAKKIKHPKDVLKRDQDVEAVIKNIDVNNRRMSLSIKETMPSAWDNFVATHKPGDVVRGRVTRFTGFGVFVELGSELEGLCHISELADERVNRAEDVVAIGQEMDFKILRIENDVQKIGLSHRAVGKEDEPVIDTKAYSTEAKGGMASLGELMNLKRGDGEEAKPEADQPRESKKERKARQAQERAEAERLAAEQAANAPQETTETAETDSTASAETETSSGETAATETASDDQPDASTDSTAEAASGESAETATSESADQTSPAATDEAQADSPASESETSGAPTADDATTVEEASSEAAATPADEAAATDDAAATAMSEGEGATEETNAAETSNAADNAAAGETETTTAEEDAEEKTANG